MSEQDILAEAIARADSVIVPSQEERALALQDRRFVAIAGAQWEGEWAEQFDNSIKVEVNKTAMGVEKIIGDYRANRMIVNFRAVGNGPHEATAEMLNGLFLADFYLSDGQEATDNAFEEGVQGGQGAFRLNNIPEDEYDPDNEKQRVAFSIIGDADQSVFWDPNSRKYNKADAQWCIVVTAMSVEAFKAEFGDDRMTSWPTEIQKAHYDWYTPEVVRVAEYYVVEVKSQEVSIYQHRATGEERREWSADLDQDEIDGLDLEGWRLLRKRMVKRRRVKKYVLSGAEILKDGIYIAGDQIPIIPFYGKRYFIDNMERSHGHVRRAKDPQRIYNAQISKLTEQAATAPTERPILTPGQVQGHEDSWARANIDRAPYSLVNPIIDPTTGQTQVSGPVGMISPPQLSPVMGALIQITANDITEITASDDGAATTKANISAEAMDIAATRTDAKGAIYIDNMKKTWQRCGEVYLSMARDVYFEEGREVETMDAEGQTGLAVIAEPYTDEKGRFSIRNDISKGKFQVFADVTEATATRRDKTVKTLLNGAQVIAPFDPELASMMTTTAMLNMDGEGITDLKDALRRRALASGLVKPTQEEQAEMEQMAQQPAEPDPQAEFLIAAAKEKQANAEKSIAGIADVKAATVLKLAQAQKTKAEIGQGDQTHKVGMMERVKSLFAPKQEQIR